MTDGRQETPGNPWIVPAILTLVAATGVTLAAFAVLRPQQPEAIAAALRDFGSTAASSPGPSAQGAPPDLTTAGLAVTASGSAALGPDFGPVHAFAYSGTGGEKVIVYLAPRPFPRPLGAPPGGVSDRWTAEVDGVFMASVEEPNAFLVLGKDRSLVQRAAALVEEQIEPSRFQGHRTESPAGIAG